MIHFDYIRNMKFTYNLNPRETFRIQMRNHLRSNLAAYSFFLLMDLILLENVKHFTGGILFVMSLPVLLLISVAFEHFFLLNKKFTAAIGGNMSVEIDEHFLKAEDEEGNSSTLNLHFVISITKKRGMYFVGFKNFNLLYIPVRVFETKEDEELFVQLIKANMGTPRKNKLEDVLD